MGGLSLAPFELSQQEGQFDLSLLIIESRDTLFGFLRYNTDLFDAGTIRRMVSHFHTLLEAAVTNPEQPVDALPLLTAAERHQLLVTWNDTQTAYPAQACFHHRFEAQVKRTPEAVAVMFGGEIVTYSGLNRRANQLAHYLQELGIGPEAVVGGCLERCPETVLSLLAIFKAGGAYLPLDPALPPERLHVMLTNADTQVVLTQTESAAHLPPEPAQIVHLDTAWERIARQPGRNPVPQTIPKNLAYVIYTSGSTGIPKGAMVTQQGMVNHLYAKVDDLRLSAAERGRPRRRHGASEL